MVLRHVGLTCSSEENSDKFYEDLLGLEKSGAKHLPASLSKSIFNLDSELVMITYQGEQVHFEIFITGSNRRNSRNIAHTCLGVDNLEVFLEKCRGLNINIARIPKGDKTLTFIRDFDGNLFEIKSG